MCLLSTCSWMSYYHVAPIKHLFTSKTISHCSTEEVKRRVCVLSQKGCRGMLSEAEPYKRRFAFWTFSFWCDDACSFHAAKVQASSFTQRNNQIWDKTGVFFFWEEWTFMLSNQTKMSLYNLPFYPLHPLKNTMYYCAIAKTSVDL